MDMNNTSSSRQGCFNVCFTKHNYLLTNRWGLLNLGENTRVFFVHEHVAKERLDEKMWIKKKCIKLICNYAAALFHNLNWKKKSLWASQAQLATVLCSGKG